jgi:porin
MALRKNTLALLFGILAFSSQRSASGQALATAGSDSQPGESQSAAEFEEIGYGSPIDPAPRMVPWIDYTGGFWDRAAMTGGWGGIRQQMMDDGFSFDVNVTQAFQGNLSGGTKHQWPYQGNVRYGIRLDTGQMGLWPGGVLAIRGETRYGQSNNLNTGALMPVNTASLYPVAEEDVTALTDLHYTQFFAPWLGVFLGKMTPRETNVFAHDETSQFMNSALNFNMIPITTVPQSFLAAGVILRPTERLTLLTQVLDSEGQADKSGFDTVFHRGTSVMQMLEVDVEPFGLPGHQRAGWTWSDKEQLQFSQDPRVVLGASITGDTSDLNRQGSDRSFLYDFDQYLYVVPGSEDRGIGVFGRLGLSDGEVNLFKGFYSIGIGGKGLIPGRKNDTFGLGYYYLSLSDKLPRSIKGMTQDEQGVELYYNIAVTPWMHITPDLQIIDPASRSVDTAVAAGVRLTIEF